MDKKKLTALMFLSTAGLLLTWWGLQAGASQAAPSTPPATPMVSLVDDWVDRTPQSPQASVRRVQTVTLDPVLDDLVKATWPVRVDDVIYNKPGGTSLKLPADACGNVVWSVASGGATKQCDASATYINLRSTPDPQPWLAVTYRTRTRAVRYRDLITVTAGASTNPPNQYEPITVTLVYDRQFPPERPDDYWGDPSTFPIPIPRFVSPSPTDQSDQERWIRWTATGYGITGTVVLSEPLFGSNLTITHLLMSPPIPKFGQRAFFTATIQNIGVITAWRWYVTELYVKPAWDLPPQNAFDHAGGWAVYDWDALFGGHGFKQPPLGPGQIHTVTTAITIPLPGTFKAYAQVDTAFTDPGHYIYSGTDPFWGSNLEGYGIAPYSEEKNVLGAKPFTVQGVNVYLPLISKQ